MLLLKKALVACVLSVVMIPPVSTHLITGLLVMKHEKSVVVKEPWGKPQTVAVSPTCEIVIDELPARWHDLLPGSSVTLTLSREPQPVAHRIEAHSQPIGQR